MADILACIKKCEAIWREKKKNVPFLLYLYISKYLLKYVILLILLMIKGFLNKNLFTCFWTLSRLLELDLLLSVTRLKDLCNRSRKSIKNCKEIPAAGCFYFNKGQTSLLCLSCFQNFFAPPTAHAKFLQLECFALSCRQGSRSTMCPKTWRYKLEKCVSVRISYKTAVLLKCSSSAGVSIGGKPVTGSWVEQQKLGRVLWPNRRAAVAQTAGVRTHIASVATRGTPRTKVHYGTVGRGPCICLKKQSHLSIKTSDPVESRNMACGYVRYMMYSR